MDQITLISPYNLANPHDGWTTGDSFPLTLGGIKRALAEATPDNMLLVDGCQPFGTACKPRQILAEAKRAKARDDKSDGSPAERGAEPGYALQHAGPYPVGSTWAADIPEKMTLSDIGAEILAHGSWILGGRWRGDGWEKYAVETAASENVKFVDFEVFTLGPGKEPVVFGLGIEFNSAARLVLTLYLDPRAFAGTMGKAGDNLLRLQEVFSEACQAMRAKVERRDGYPAGVTWDPKTGIGRAN